MQVSGVFSWDILSHDTPELPLDVTDDSFRLLLLSGSHDCFQAHIFRFAIDDSPLCKLCGGSGQSMTAEHLGMCSALNHSNGIAEKYWQTRCLMAYRPM